MEGNALTIDAQADLLLRGTFFADEDEGSPATDETSLRQQMRAELVAKLRKGRPLRVYLGVDPTATSLHIGHLVPALKLRQFQALGHQAIFLIGDYTGLIGDPSGQTKERPQLTGEELEEMSRGYTEQVFRVLDEAATEVRRNSEWLGKMGFADIIRLASLFPLKQIIARREFQERMEAGKPLRFHETLYPLMQGYDAFALDCDVQVGGYDQHFNLLAGRAIQQGRGQEPHVMITLPLLAGTDGRKMSKSYGNSVNIQDTPRDMFGKLMRISDEQILPYLDLACMLMDTHCNQQLRHAYEESAKNPIEIKEEIAHHVVSQYHGPEVGDAERAWFESHIRQKKLPDDIPEIEVSDALLAEDAQWAGLLVALGLLSSKGEVRRLIKGGGFRVAGEQVQDPFASYDGADDTLVQYGKRRFATLRRPKGGGL
ncbi:MAG: tyrosine--tRNA ligase [bacterium]